MIDNLGRYYTKDFVSCLLINNLKTNHPQMILDLGVGDASLTIAAYTRWKSAKFYATEIEHKKISELKDKLTFLKIFHCDTLKPFLQCEIKVKIGKIDVAICNPPYKKILNVKIYEKLFKRAGCDSFLKMGQITSEMVFFAHNITLLRDGGELGIIVSDTLITGKNFQTFRQVLLSKFNLTSVIQLPDKIFKKTEARTHILILSKTSPTSSTCELFSADENGILSQKIIVHKKEMADRMDYQYFYNKQFILNKLPTLKDINAVITRGKLSYKELRSQNNKYFHSTHLGSGDSLFSFDEYETSKQDVSYTKSGDILMCRVGKRSLGKVAFIEAGNLMISDCIFKISVDDKYQKTVWNSLMSEKGKLWIKCYAHGVCSQVISKCDLMNFPLFDLE